MEPGTSTAMQYQMQSYPRDPETQEITTKSHPNDTPITPPSTLPYYLKKKKDAKEKELTTTVARKDTTLMIIT